MNHKLAKQLKDAGFPQKGEGKYWTKQLGRLRIPKGGVVTAKEADRFAGTELPGTLTQEDYNNQFCYIPTLEELIDACGDRLHCLTRFWKGKKIDGWYAIYIKNVVDSFPSYIKGKTPKVAVAKSWLKINESIQKER